MILSLRRRATFSAGFSQPISVSGGIGHDYIVELTVAGEVDPRTGMVVNIKDVDAALQGRVIAALHGKVLDRDVPVFRDVPPSPERLAEFVWSACRPAFSPPSVVTRAAVLLNPTLRAELGTVDPRDPQKKDPLPVFTVTRSYDFSASHRLHALELSEAENADVFGKCNWANGHGHNYDVEVTVTGEPDGATGRIVNLETLDAIVDQEILAPFDHRHLNHDVPEFRDLNPTSENLTRVIWERLARRGEELGTARLFRVVVRETARNYFEYYGDEKAPLESR